MALICIFKINAIERCSLNIRQELETLDDTNDCVKRFPFLFNTFCRVTIRNLGFGGIKLTFLHSLPWERILLPLIEYC